jgi:hypothetical protein
MTHVPIRNSTEYKGNSTYDAGYNSRIKCVGYSLGRPFWSEVYHRPNGNPNPTRDLGGLVMMISCCDHCPQSPLGYRSDAFQLESIALERNASFRFVLLPHTLLSRNLFFQ